MAIRDDLLSNDVPTISKGLGDLDIELRKKLDRSDLLDILITISASADPEIVRRTTWCAAKMGQNKVNDGRIITLLAALAESGDPQVRENVAWGIGETAGTIGMDADAVGTLSSLLDDGDRDVRGMAAWAAGRFRHKCEHMTEKVRIRLNELLGDSSEYVRSAAKFALDG
jgi:HEAT repeat protein